MAARDLQDCEGYAGGLETPETAAQEASPSFDHLPLELRLKCLANCDWQTLSRASCASRSTRALVRTCRGGGGCIGGSILPDN